MHIYIYGICIEGDGTTRNYQNDHRCNPKTRIMSVASMQVVASELGIIKIEWQITETDQAICGCRGLEHLTDTPKCFGPKIWYST